MAIGFVAALGACTGLTVDPVGRPCDEQHPCGSGSVCDPVSGTCVKALDAQVQDLPVQPDVADRDAPAPDLPSSDLPSGDLPAGDLPSGDLSPVDILQPDFLQPDMLLPDVFSPDVFVAPDAGCPTGLTQCGTECADLNTSFNHCGQCNTPCPSGATNQCLNGQCVCGATGGACGAGLNCIGGACVCVLGGRCLGCCSDPTTCVPLGSFQSTTSCGKNGEACKNCHDQNYCTEDTCTATGDCLSTNRPDGEQCSDGDDCTYSDSCQGGVCQGTAYSCDDGIECTANNCLGTPPPNNCANPISWGRCLINGVCYYNGESNPAAVCQEICIPSQSNTAWTTNTGPCVTTIAGDGSDSFGNGAALSASFNDPGGIVLGSGGQVYVADRDNNRIRLIAGGTVSTFAGTGTQGSADGAALTQAQFDRPQGLAIDASGAIYVADDGNDMIRKISGGQVTTIAGTGVSGFANGPALTQAQFNSPRGVAVDASGVVYVADYYNHRIRMISGGQVMTFAGDGTAGFLDGPALQAQFDGPRDVALDSSGALYVADRGNYRIRKISGGQVTTIAGSGTTAGFLDGAAATSQLVGPYGVAVDSSGTVYFSDTDYSDDDRIRMISSGTVSTLAGSGITGFRDGPATSARFDSPRQLAVDSTGKVYVADEDNHRIRMIIP